MNKSKLVLGAVTVLGGISAAHAGFVPIDTLGTSVAQTITIVDSNDFKSIMAGVGVTKYTLGATLGVDTAGTVTYYYYGKEAGYKNIFSAPGGLSYDSGFTPTSQNYFAKPITIGSVDVGAGALSFGFCSYSGPTTLVGCVNNAQNDWLNLGSFQSIAFSAAGNLAWIYWDDSGAGPDDNHDDMLIKAVFTPRSVPEPATLGLFGLGLLGLWTGARRRAARKI